MLITRTSMLSGKETTMDIDCTEEQLNAWLGGMYIQDAMPNVPAEQREFLISGTTPEEWSAMFPEEEG